MYILSFSEKPAGLRKRISHSLGSSSRAGGSLLAATDGHLDHHNGLEVVIRKGRSSGIRPLAERIIRFRGVKHGRLVITTTGKSLK